MTTIRTPRRPVLPTTLRPTELVLGTSGLSRLVSVDSSKITDPLMTFDWKGAAPATVTLTNDGGTTLFGPFTVTGNTAQATGLVQGYYTVHSQAENEDGELDRISGGFSTAPVRSKMDKANDNTIPNPLLTFTWEGAAPATVTLLRDGVQSYGPFAVVGNDVQTTGLDYGYYVVSSQAENSYLQLDDIDISGSGLLNYPAFTTQPLSGYITEGQSLTFTAVLEGAVPVTYQWQLNSQGAGVFADIPGATSANYTTPNLTVERDAGNEYRCNGTANAVPKTSVIAYAYGSPDQPIVKTEVGTFASIAGTGQQVISLDPAIWSGDSGKAVLIWGNLDTTDQVAPGFLINFGLSASNVSRAATSVASEDAQNPSITDRRVHNVKAVSAITYDGVLSEEASFVSFGANQFTIDWTTNSGASTLYNFMVIGGDDVEAKVQALQSPGSSQSVGYTGIGFKPDCLIAIGVGTTANLQTNVTANWYFGISDGTTDTSVFVNSTNGVSTVDSVRRHTNRFIDCNKGDDYATVTSLDADGFTLNWTTDTFLRYNFVLCLKGVSAEIIDGLEPVSNTTVDRVVSFTPECGLCLTAMAPDSANQEDDARAGVGGWSGSNMATIGAFEQDGVSPSNSNCIRSSTEVIKHIDETGTVVGSMTASASGSTVVEDWGDTDGTARKHSWLFVGGEKQFRADVPAGSQFLYAANFDGVDDAINCTSNAGVANIFDGGGTLALWANLSSGTLRALADKATWSFNTANESAGFCKVYLWRSFSGNVGVWRIDNTDIQLNSWVHIALTYDDSDVANDPIFYVNGVAVAASQEQIPVGTGNSDASDVMYLGNWAAKTRTAQGLISDYHAYNIILTPQEIADLANHTDPNCSCLKLRLTLNGEYIDVSGSDPPNDGTPEGY